MRNVNPKDEELKWPKTIYQQPVDFFKKMALSNPHFCSLSKSRFLQMDIIGKTIEFVKNELENAEGGHDWHHIHRVWKTAKTIAREEEANMLVVELLSLIHI